MTSDRPDPTHPNRHRRACRQTGPRHACASCARHRRRGHCRRDRWARSRVAAHLPQCPEPGGRAQREGRLVRIGDPGPRQAGHRYGWPTGGHGAGPGGRERRSGSTGPGWTCRPHRAVRLPRRVGFSRGGRLERWPGCDRAGGSVRTCRPQRRPGTVRTVWRAGIGWPDLPGWLLAASGGDHRAGRVDPPGHRVRRGQRHHHDHAAADPADPADPVKGN